MVFLQYAIRFDLRSTVWAPEVTKVQKWCLRANRFFANNFWHEQVRAITIVPSCSPRQDEWNGISFDLERSTLKVDLRSRSRNDLRRSWSTSYDASWQDKHIGACPMPLSQLYQKLYAKNAYDLMMTSCDLIWPFQGVADAKTCCGHHY